MTPRDVKTISDAGKSLLKWPSQTLPPVGIQWVLPQKKYRQIFRNAVQGVL